MSITKVYQAEHRPIYSKEFNPIGQFYTDRSKAEDDVRKHAAESIVKALAGGAGSVTNLSGEYRISNRDIWTEPQPQSKPLVYDARDRRIVYSLVNVGSFSDPEKSYTVGLDYNGEPVDCTCEAYKFAPPMFKNCKHMIEVEAHS